MERSEIMQVDGAGILAAKAPDRDRYVPRFLIRGTYLALSGALAASIPATSTCMISDCSIVCVVLWCEYSEKNVYLHP